MLTTTLAWAALLPALGLGAPAVLVHRHRHHRGQGAQQETTGAYVRTLQGQRYMGVPELGWGTGWQRLYAGEEGAEAGRGGGGRQVARMLVGDAHRGREEGKGRNGGVSDSDEDLELRGLDFTSTESSGQRRLSYELGDDKDDLFFDKYVDDDYEHDFGGGERQQQRKQQQQQVTEARASSHQDYHNKHEFFLDLNAIDKSDSQQHQAKRVNVGDNKNGKSQSINSVVTVKEYTAPMNHRHGKFTKSKEAEELSLMKNTYSRDVERDIKKTNSKSEEGASLYLTGRAGNGSVSGMTRRNARPYGGRDFASTRDEDGPSAHPEYVSAAWLVRRRLETDLLQLTVDFLKVNLVTCLQQAAAARRDGDGRSKRVAGAVDLVSLSLEADLLANSRDFLFSRLVTCRAGLRAVVGAEGTPRHSPQHLLTGEARRRGEQAGYSGGEDNYSSSLFTVPNVSMSRSEDKAPGPSEGEGVWRLPLAGHDLSCAELQVVGNDTLRMRDVRVDRSFRLPNQDVCIQYNPDDWRDSTRLQPAVKDVLDLRSLCNAIAQLVKVWGYTLRVRVIWDCGLVENRVRWHGGGWAGTIEDNGFLRDLECRFSDRVPATVQRFWQPQRRDTA